MRSFQTISPIVSVDTLDFDPVFLDRFSVDQLMSDKVTFLYETEDFSWDEAWERSDRSPLWNFNLHYFEFLFPLVSAYKESGEAPYLKKLQQIIGLWIANDPVSGGSAGWAPYTIALRLTNWLGVYTALKADLDPPFSSMMIRSIWEQYQYLARHLEKDLLGNHYFEDLKALVLCSLFFRDEKMFRAAVSEFKKECREQILPDGMHFERSPMYHKIILEDMIRVCAALRSAGRADAELEAYLQPMADVAYSLEAGLDRIPLFNDGGNNVAKSLDALMKALKDIFGIVPAFKSQLPDSGYYIFRQGDWRLIVDAGQPGPAYIPGHAHCDAGSFELFRGGKPVIVNCGTYAYQCRERGFFRSTAAHNTVMAAGVEQSQCWGAFRLAKRAKVQVLKGSDTELEIKITDQKGNMLIRRFRAEPDTIQITDSERTGKPIQAYLHFVDEAYPDWTMDAGEQTYSRDLYAPEYGRLASVRTLCAAGTKITFTLSLRERAAD